MRTVYGVPWAGASGRRTKKWLPECLGAEGGVADDLLSGRVTPRSNGAVDNWYGEILQGFPGSSTFFE